MDERLSGDIVPPKLNESLPEQTFVYRMCLFMKRDKDNNFSPTVRNFTPTANDKDGLSVDWENMTTPEDSIARFGAQLKFGKLNEYKEFAKYEIYKLQIKYVKGLPDVTDVIYSPIYTAPPSKGQPNNPAHSLITFSKHPLEDECETLLKMRDHAVENQKVQVDYEGANAKAEELKKQWV